MKATPAVEVRPPQSVLRGCSSRDTPVADSCRASAAIPPPRAERRGKPLFCDDRLERLNVQRPLGHDLLQTPISPSTCFSRCISLSPNRDASYPASPFYITGERLRMNVIRYESGMVQSHYSEYVTANATNNLDLAVEGIIGRPNCLLRTLRPTSGLCGQRINAVHAHTK